MFKGGLAMEENFYFRSGKVYIGCRKEDIDNQINCSSKYFNDIIADNCDKESFKVDGQSCRKRIRDEIVVRANRYIKEASVMRASTNVYSYASSRQFRRLNKVFDKKSGEVSCFALIMLLSTFDLLVEGKYSNATNFIKNYIDYIYNIVNRSMANKKEGDDVAQYLIDCYKPICNHIQNPHSNELKLPPVPKILIIEDRDE